MPPIASILGFSNRWYPGLIANAVPVSLPGGTQVLIGDAPHLLAMKLEAFHGRGETDYRLSRDISDKIVLIDGREELFAELKRAPENLRQCIAKQFSGFLSDPDCEEAFSAHLPGDGVSQGRTTLIVKRMQEIASLRDK